MAGVSDDHNAEVREVARKIVADAVEIGGVDVLRSRSRLSWL